MFDAVRNNKRIVQFILLLITVPFALWGVDWYTRSGGGANEVASVGGVSIGAQEFQEALREQQDRLRSALGTEFDSSILETPEARKAVLDSLIVQRLLALQSGRWRFSISDDQLRQFLGSVPAFQDEGKFSMERYEAVARNQGLSPVGFETRIRQDLVLQQVVEPVVAAALVPASSGRRQLSLERETRSVSEFVISREELASRIKLDSNAAQNYYDGNQKQFEVPEQVRAEFLVLNPTALAESVSVTDEQVKAWYDANREQYQQAEERRASHILLSVDKDAGAEQKGAVRAKIETLERQLRQSPLDFERVAREFSQDPGSSAKGGDLGYFGRGTMVKPFEEAVFGLKENQISEVVESDFGFHLIKLTGIKPSRVRELDEAKAEIVAELKRQAAGKRFAEVADEFSNLVYEQSDSLAPAAEKLKLKVQQSGWITKGIRVPGEIGDKRVIDALFSEESTKNKRNTEALEVGPNTLVAARVVEHKAPQLRPFDEVRASIEKQLTSEEASKLAQKEAEEKLALLQKGGAADVAWRAPKKLTRASAQEVSPEGLRRIFALPSDGLPRYAGAPGPGGSFVLYKLHEVNTPEVAADDSKLTGVRGQLSRLYGEEDFAAYLAALRQRYTVSIVSSALEGK